MKVHALTAIALPLGPSGEPPIDFTLIRRGVLSTVYGDFVFDDESARLCAEAWSRRARRFMWDYEHMSGLDGRNGKPLANVHDRRSAGDADPPVADASGFHLRNQQWTPDARGYITRREYLYFSPVIAVDEKAKPQRIVDVLKSSLTNDPATLGCAPLTLSAAEEAVLLSDARAASESAPSHGRDTICLDFDGVIHPNHPSDPELANPPIDGSREGVDALRKQYRVAVQSARVKDEASADAIRSYLAAHGIQVDEVTGQKPVAKLYVDDKGLRFTGSWPALVDRAQRGDFDTWEQGNMSSEHELAAKPGGEKASGASNVSGVKVGPVEHSPDAYPKDDSMEWDGSAAEKRVWDWAGVKADGEPDFAKARPMFGVVVEPGTRKSDYKLIHHDIRGGHPVTVRGGVRAAMNAIQGARGGVDMPESFVSGVKSHLQAEAHRFDDKAPWEKEELNRNGSVALAESADATMPPILQQGVKPMAVPAPTAPGVAKLSKRDRKRPHGSKAKQAVAVLVEREGDKHSLWARRVSSNKYAAPGGYVKKHDPATSERERPVDAALRELREESGIAAKPHDMHYMGTVRLRHPRKGHAIDVHGYRLTVPADTEAKQQEGRKKEFSGPWEWHPSHPTHDMHSPRNALTILSAQQTAQPATARKQQVALSESTNMKIIGSTSTMDIQKARALTSTLLGGLPALSGEGVESKVASAAQAALQSLKNLDDALSAAGATGEGVSIDESLNLSAAVMEITGSKTMDGIVGRVYALADAAKVAPVALNLSVEQASKLEIDRGIKRGAINPSEKARYYDLIGQKRLSLSDCRSRADGAVIYDVPSTAAVPAGANSTTVDLSKPAPAQAAPAAITATSGQPAAKTVELSEQHKQLLDSVERHLPEGQKINRESVLKALTSQGAPQAPRMSNPSQPA